LFATLSRSAIPFGEDRLSLLPMLAALRGRIARQKRLGRWPDEDPGCVYSALAAAVAKAIHDAAPLSERDIAFWTRAPDGPTFYGALHAFFGIVARSGPPGPAAMLADLLLRNSGSVPPRRCATLAVRLRPWLGARLAGTLALRWMGRAPR
jgi:hypothetical protein